jgi:hypothetical protein
MVNVGNDAEVPYVSHILSETKATTGDMFTIQTEI